MNNNPFNSSLNSENDDNKTPMNDPQIDHLLSLVALDCSKHEEAQRKNEAKQTVKRKIIDDNQEGTMDSHNNLDGIDRTDQLIRDVLQPISTAKYDEIEQKILAKMASSSNANQTSVKQKGWFNKLKSQVSQFLSPSLYLPAAGLVCSIAIAAFFMLHQPQNFSMQYNMTITGGNKILRSDSATLVTNSMSEKDTIETFYSNNEMTVFLKPNQAFTANIQVAHYLKNENDLIQLVADNKIASSGAVKSTIFSDNWQSLNKGDYMMVSVISDQALPSSEEVDHHLAQVTASSNSSDAKTVSSTKAFVMVAQPIRIATEK